MNWPFGWDKVCYPAEKCIFSENYKFVLIVAIVVIFAQATNSRVHKRALFERLRYFYWINAPISQALYIQKQHSFETKAVLKLVWRL